MPLGDYLTGLLFYVPTAGASLAAALLLTRRFYAHLPGLLRLLAFATLLSAALVVACVLPAAASALTRGTVLAVALVEAAVAVVISRRPPAPRRDQDPPPPPSRPVSVAISLAAVGAVLVYSLARLRTLATQPITDVDMLGFHLPGIARFIQTGTLWRVDQFLPGFATAQYPNSGDFLILSSVLPWRDLAFVRFLPGLFFGLSGVATYALGIELRASRAAAAAMAAAAVSVPALSLLALEGVPDAISLGTFVIGTLFLLRHERRRHTSDLVLAGVAFALAFGTKWYGATSVAIVCIVWAAARLVARRGLRRLAADAGLLAALILLGGGIWLLRNVVESGNPIYPKAVSPLGLHVFAGSYRDVIDLYGHTIANYLGNPHVLRTFIYPAFKQRVGVTGIVLVAGLVLTVGASALRLRRSPRCRLAQLPLLGLTIGVLGMCAEYAITPGSAYGPKNLPVEAFVNVRWLMPAILLAGALAASAVRALGSAGWLLELGGLLGVLDAVHLDPPVSTGAALALAAVIVVLGLAWIMAARRLPGWRSVLAAQGPKAWLALGGAALLGLCVLARVQQQRFDRHSYARFDPALAWIEAHASSGHRVGVTGVWSDAGPPPTLPAFGPRLGNVVEYVGDPVRHSLHLPRSRRTFLSELRRGRYDLLLIGLQDPDHTDAWARAAGFRLVAASPRLVLYAASRAPGASSSR